jgi:hypothetical protein
MMCLNENIMYKSYENSLYIIKRRKISILILILIKFFVYIYTKGKYRLYIIFE